jgi:hypothetical protein
MTPAEATASDLDRLEATREDLYRLADRVPALSLRLTTATRAITEALAAFAASAREHPRLHEQLLAASNAIAAASDEATPGDPLQLQLAAVYAVLDQVRQRVRRIPGVAPRPTLRLVHP